MCSKLRLTVLVPAPDEPVMAMTGCLADMVLSPQLWRIGCGSLHVAARPADDAKL
jgi:hypothetical protein